MFLKLKLICLCILFSICTYAQTYSERWKKIESLEQKANYKAAFKVISKIEKKANKEHNETQKIKSFLYTAKYNNVWIENYEQSFFININKEIKKAKAPYANWLNYIAAKSLQDYFHKNQYKISSKINLDLKNNWNLKDWDKSKFNNEIATYLENSISNPEVLKNSYLKDYEELIDFGDEFLINNERNLFDFFASNYNSFYISSKKISSKEILNKIKNSYPEKAFWRENVLSTIILDSVNKINNSLEALKYTKTSSKNILNKYIQEKINLKTVVRVYNQEVYNNKSNVLPELIKDLRVLSLSNNSKIKKTATSYLEKIMAFNSRLEFPYQSVSNQNFIGILKSKNTNQVYIDIFKAEDFNTKDLKDTLLKNIKPFKSFQSLIKDNKLHTFTKKEIIFPALPVGDYVVVVKNEKDYTEKSSYQITQLKVSDLHLVSFKEKNEYKFQILNGKNGSINTNATLICNDKTILAKNNFYTIPHTENLEIKAFYKSDTIQKNIYYYNYNTEEKENISHNIKFYSDRNLYEPGEKVQFKIIALKQNKEVAEVLINERLTIYLSNASNKNIDSLDVITNTFGSANGYFTLPKNALNGTFTLKTKLKDQQFYNSFQVEEFKIPTFEIKIDPITQSINPADKTITLTGVALGFSENPIQNATGSFTYELNNDKNEDDFFEDNDENIINTTSNKEKSTSFTTDNEGKFKITLPLKFNEITDEDLGSWYKPEVITYNIKFEILDKSGEKQTKNFSFKTSPKLFYSNTNAILTPQTNEMEILLESKDINNINIPTRVMVDIYEIQNNVSNKFLNTAQTQEIEDRISPEEFQQLYPELEYESEIEKSKWKVISKTKQITKDCKGEITIKGNELKDLKQGWYKIVASYTKDNVTANDTAYIFKPNPTYPKVLKNYLDTNITKQKNKLILNYNTAFNAFNLHQIIFVDNNIYQTKELKLNKGTNTEIIAIDIKPEQKIEVLTYGVLNNNVINNRTTYLEPKEDNKTEIKILTFRDKLTPNSVEQWKLKINTNVNNKSFEVLAALHNKALDKIYSSNNFYNDLKSYYSNHIFHYLDINNQVSRYNKSRQLYVSYNRNTINFNNQNDQFNWFDFNINTYTFPNIKWRNEYKKPIKNIEKEFTIKGIVLGSDKIPLSGVSITLKDKITGVSTDLDGKFKIKVTKKDIISLTFIGFKTQEFEVKPYAEYTIYLEEDYNSLEEVVVTGYKSKNDQVQYTSPEITTSDKDSDFNKILNGTVNGLKITSGSGKPGTATNVTIRGKSSMGVSSTKNYLVDGVITSQSEIQKLKEEDIYSAEIINNTIIITTKKTQQKLSQIKARETKEYTGFFFPHITTNTKGEFNLNFTAPQSSAGWKLRLLAHNKEGESTSISKDIITQKQFMVQPNWPTFLKETEKITIKSKIVNLENSITKGKTQLQILDSKTQNDITNLFAVENQIQNFSIQPNQDTITSWQVNVPKIQQNLIFKIVAFNETAQDGEQINIPIISNTQIIEKATPIWVNPSENFVTKVENNINQKTKIKITNNVNALILQAIPYIVKGKNTTSTELFNKIYAQIIGSYLVNNNPELKEKVKQITSETRAILKQNNSNEIENTPWNIEANNHQKQIEVLALYLHPDEIEDQIIADLQELKSYKLTNGFPWLKYGTPNHEITFQILSGLGEAQSYTKNSIIQKEIQEIAGQVFNEIDKEVQQSISKKETPYFINSNSYLFARSFYKNLTTSKEIKNYIDKTLKTSDKTTNYNQKAKLAMLYYNNDQKDKAQKILKQIKESAVIDQTKGMYFKANANTETQNQIETQANIIKAFKLITNDSKVIQNLTNALIYNKNANHWENQHQTTIAISALASKIVQNKSEYSISVNNKKIIPNKDFYNSIDLDLKPEDKVLVNNKSNTPIFGGIYSQAQQEIQAITASNNPEIQIIKQYFLNQNNKIKEQNTFKIGDLITVKLTITTLQNQNFIVVTDNRISIAVPEQQLSENKVQNGINYYQTNNTANTKFYITNLPKGTHSIEYNLRATHNGMVNTGITTIESMYTPQIKANTNNLEINIKE